MKCRIQGVRTILLGQGLAALIALTAMASSVLAKNGHSFPTLQSTLNYALLGIVYGTWHTVRTLGSNDEREAGRAVSKKEGRLWAVLLVLALLDVEANVIVVLSYRYASITSVVLLQCWSIPVALALTRALGLASYKIGHYVGMVLCVLGLAVLVGSDTQRHPSGSQPAGDRSLLGDVLVLIGSSLYACCNVVQEHLLFDVSVWRMLGALGIFGFVVSSLQGGLLEMQTAIASTWGWASIVALAVYVLAMFAFYSLVPFQLAWGGAAMLNISLLASDIWAALFRWFFLGGFTLVDALFFIIALSLLGTGIGWYSWSGEAKHKRTCDIVTPLRGNAIGRVDDLSDALYLPIPLAPATDDTVPSGGTRTRSIDILEQERTRGTIRKGPNAASIDLQVRNGAGPF